MEEGLTLLRKEQSRSPGRVGGSSSGGRLRVKLRVPRVRKARSQGRGYPNQAHDRPPTVPTKPEASYLLTDRAP